MKILTTKQQHEAIIHINAIKNAIISGNELMMFNSIENLAELTYIIGGMKELQRNCSSFIEPQESEANNEYVNSGV
jgi:hypothetical protein